jgi:hypothetical protein
MGFKRDSPDSPQAGWWVWFGTPFSMIVGYVQKSDKDQRGYSPSTDWAQGGPIIEQDEITLHRMTNDWVAVHNPSGDGQPGQHPLIAAMRCYVASKLGDEVEVPEELL